MKREQNYLLRICQDRCTVTYKEIQQNRSKFRPKQDCNSELQFTLILLVNQVKINHVKTHIALKVVRFSSKKVSSSVKNLETRKVKIGERTFRNGVLKKETFMIKRPTENGSNLIKFVVMDELWIFADAGLARPPSNRTAWSSSFTVTPPKSARLMSEWLQCKKLQSD